MNEFSSREDGYMRASDLSGPSSFPSTEPVTFGETLNRLPDLAKWKHALTKKMSSGKGGPSSATQESHSFEGGRKVDEVDTNHHGDEHDDDGDDNEGQMELKKRSKKRKQQGSILDRLGADDAISAVAYSDDFLSHSTLAIHNPLTQYLKGKSSNSNKSQTKVNSSVGQSVAKTLELDKIREQSRLAYQQLKANRKLAANR